MNPGKLDRTIICGDCLLEMPKMAENSIDSIVTDPPYGLKFMSAIWDHGIPGIAFWKEALRVAKPGAHLLAFGGTRTHHRLMVAIEDAGWEIRDTIGWMYFSGFPKSLNIGKAIDKAAGAEREVVGQHECGGCRTKGVWLSQKTVVDDTAPATAESIQWEGWGTGLKPAWEPIILARKPIEKGLTIAENVVKWGTGGINVDGCRVSLPEGDSTKRKPSQQPASTDLALNHCKTIGSITDDWKKGRFPANLIHDGSEEVTELFPNSKSKGGLKPAWEPIIIARKPIDKGLTIAENVVKWGTGGINVDGCRVGVPIKHEPGGLHRGSKTTVGSFTGTTNFEQEPHGRFPANLIHDGSEEVTELFPNSKSKGHSVWSSSGFKGTGGKKQEEDNGGSAARFFYCAKASKQDRDEGLESFGSQSSGVGALRDNGRTSLPRHNGHPTVKPTKLMAYLCRLVTPPGGLVLDPFAGSGSTGKACKAEGFKFLGIEMNEEYCKIARARIL